MNNQQTIRVFDRIAAPINLKGSIIKYSDAGLNYDFHLERIRNRVITKQTSSPEISKGAHSHAVFHLILVTDGIGRIFHQGQSVMCRKQDLVIINPNELHCLNPQTSQRLQFFALTFYLTNENNRYSEPFSRYLANITGMEIENCSQKKISKSAFQELQIHFEHTLDLLLGMDIEKNHYQISLQLLTIFGIIASELQQLEYIPTGNSKMERVRSYIEKNYNQPISIEELAELACMSKGHFIRSFKEEYQQTPILYQQDLRIQQAVKILSDTSWTLEKIAGQTGFSNVYYFSKIFKQRTGTAPGRYRQSLKD